MNAPPPADGVQSGPAPKPARWTDSWLFGMELGRGELAGIALILVAGFIQLWLVRAAVVTVRQLDPASLPLLLPAALLASLLCVRFRADQLPAIPRLYLKGLALFAVAYALLEPFDFPIAVPALAGIDTRLAAERAVAIVCGIVAIRRPSFLLPALLYGAIGRASMAAATDIAISKTDFENVLEAAIFASSIGFTVPLAFWIGRRSGASGWSGVGATLVVAASIGGHLGSYFHSGLAKLRLDGVPLSWMLDNQTQQGILIGLEKGTFPFASSLWLTQLSYDVVGLNPAIGNVLVVVAQLLALVAMFRRRLLIAFTLVYDLFHLGVYLIYGLLFWKWVALNLVIVATVARGRERLPPAFTLTGVAMILFGQYFVWTAHLAWYDSSNMVSPYLEAVTRDGRAVRVPPAAFGSLSYPFSHADMFIPKDRKGHFPMVRWGSYFNYRAVVASRRCEPAPFYEPRPEGAGSLATVAAAVNARHRQLLGRLDRNGSHNVYLYPHHHYPSPFTRSDYGKLDLRTVVGYRWVVESVCLSLVEGRLQRKVLKRSEYALGAIPLGGSTR